jgi:hypothetical protein
MTAMANLTAQKRVPLDAAWKPVLECASLEVFEMMADARLTPASHPPPHQGSSLPHNLKVD